MKEKDSIIYSRHRLKIFKKGKKTKIQYIYIGLIILVCTYSIAIKAIKPVFETICLDKAKSIANKISNDETGNAMEGYNYNDLFTIEKDNERKYPNDKCKYFYNR